MRVSLQRTYNFKLLAIIAFAFLLGQLLSPIQPLRGSSDGAPDPEFDKGLKQQPTKSKGEWVYAKIEYLHDLIAPNRYFMLLRAHPGQPVPLITGGYATTDVYLSLIHISEPTRPY